MRRIGAAMLAVVVLVAAALFIAWPRTSCACVTPPTPPSWPVSEAAARAAASRLAGTEPYAPAWQEAGGSRLWVFAFDGATVLIDGDRGNAIAYVATSSIPSSAGTPTDAEGVATTFLDAHGISHQGLSATVGPVAVDGAPRATSVVWAPVGGSPAIEVYVAADGSVFWLADHRGNHVDLRAPLVGAADARSRAAAAAGRGDLESGGFWIRWDERGREAAEWTFYYVVVSQTDKRAVHFIVDATTGAVRTEK